MGLGLRRLNVGRSVRRLVSREARGLPVPRYVCVKRGSRVYSTRSDYIARLSSGLGEKDCVPFFFLRGACVGELIFTRRPHFFIDKKKKK